MVDGDERSDGADEPASSRARRWIPVDPGASGADEGVGGTADSLPVLIGTSAPAVGEPGGVAVEAAGAVEAGGVDASAAAGSWSWVRCTRSLIPLCSPGASVEDSITSAELRRSWVRLAELSEGCSNGTEVSRSSGG